MSTSRNFWLLVTSLPVLLLLVFQIGVRRLQPSTVKREDVAVVYAGISAWSHLEKAQPLISGLVQLGYPVTFVTGEEQRNYCLSTGAEFEPLDGPKGAASEEELAAFFEDSKGQELFLAKTIFMGHMHEHLNTIQRVFESLYLKYEKVVYIHDSSFFALLPVQLGSPGVLPTVSIGFGLTNLPLDSHDTYPFPATTAPAAGSAARRLHRLAYQNVTFPLRLALDTALSQKLKEMNAIEPYPSFYHALGGHDQYIAQLGLPEFEYNRTDVTPEVRFLGLPETTGGSRDLPSWWDEVATARKQGKSVIVVTQGTVSPLLRNLLIPTIEALRERDDILLIATTVTQSPDIEGLDVPANTRLARFIPFDVLLSQASIVVCTGGFGTVLHAIRAGVPMILAGTQQDKAHIATLAEHVGIAVNMKTDQPSANALRAAILQVLDEKYSVYKDSINKLQSASKQYNPVERLDAIILEAVSA